MVPEIKGKVAVGFHVPLTGRPGLPIGQSISPIYYDGDDLSPVHVWQYFEAGMVVWSGNTCASTLYGPIFEFYGEAGQFAGPLGSPRTDVTQLPDGTFYAVFENGVLWLDSRGTVHGLSPQKPAFIKSLSGIDPSASGVMAFAQQKLQSIANNALQTNQELSANVNSITTTITSVATGSGGCKAPPGDNIPIGQPGTSLVRSHVFGVHFDFSLSGCAGIFGDASADLHLEVRLNVTPPKISGFLVRYHIDGVSSPLGAGDTQLWDGLYLALQGYYGTDLIGKSLQLPNGFTLLSVLVDFFGNVNVYIEPTVCGTTALLKSADAPDQDSILRRIRQVRTRLAETSDGEALIQATEAMIPVLLDAIRTEPDARRLSLSIADLLRNAFQDDDDVPVRFKELAEPARQLHRLLNLLERQGSPELTEHLVARAVKFIREAVSAKVSFGEVMRSLDDMLAEETRRLGSK